MWLLNKLFTHNNQPTPRFAFQGTVNWMRGLALLTENNFAHQDLRQFYQAVQRRAPNEEADALAFECLVMSMHNVSTINSMRPIENPYAIVRSAIIAWYYAIYYASKSMLAASSGTDPQTHAATGRIWQTELVDANFVKAPFDLSIINITPTNVEQQIINLRNGNNNDLNLKPTNLEMAYGAACSYLKGTAEYEQWRLEEQVRESTPYRQGGYSNFRTNAAKQLRDARLIPAHVNFLIQAFRYRGKANYRDAIYLSYGGDDAEQLREFVSDLYNVSCAFSCMSAHYVSKRVVRDDWQSFIADMDEFIRFDLPFNLDEI